MSPCLSLRAPMSAALALVPLLGCSGERWVIGEATDAGTDAAAAADLGASPTCMEAAPEGIPPLAPPPALSEAHLGSWLATLAGSEAAAFPASAVVLRLNGAAASLRFENGSSAPPVLDAAAGYLCSTSVSSCASEAGFVAGFDYRLAELRARGSILSFGLFLDEPWDEWCRLQTPVERTQPGCEPSYDVERPYAEARWVDGCAVRRGEEWTAMACDRLATVARGVCACTADGCRARARLQPVSVQLVAPGRLEGALWFGADRAQPLSFSSAP
jgi:hypothetical protein